MGTIIADAKHRPPAGAMCVQRKRNISTPDILSGTTTPSDSGRHRPLPLIYSGLMKKQNILTDGHRWQPAPSPRGQRSGRRTRTVHREMGRRVEGETATRVLQDDSSASEQSMPPPTNGEQHGYAMRQEHTTLWHAERAQHCQRRHERRDGTAKATPSTPSTALRTLARM